MTLASNPRAVVTGAGSGIGRAFSLALARRGGRVLVADVNRATADETAELVRAAGGKAHVVLCDVSSKEQVFALPAVMKEQFGGTDLVINNAGVAVSGPAHEIPASDWEWLMGINLFGVIYGCLAFLPELRAQRSGHLLNVASAAGLISSPRLAPYNVSKAGVVALSESLSSELAEVGVGVSVLCPTFIRTNIDKAGRKYGAGTEEAGERLMARAKKTADEIAEITLEGVAKDLLYIVPHPDGLWAWRAKRANPENFYKRIIPRAAKAMEEGRDYEDGNALTRFLKKIRR